MISVIMPAKDEANSIGGLIARTRVVLSAYKHEIITVDDGSKDKTVEIARNGSAITLSHARSLGKGAAMKSGVKLATGDILVFLDSDGAHNPEDIPNVIAPILRNEDTLVIGSRDFRSSEATGYPILRILTNVLASFITSVIISYLLPLVTLLKYPVKWRRVVDAESGFKALSRGKWHKLNLISQGFEIETEIIYEAVKNGLNIENVTIDSNWNCKNSHLSTLRDGSKTLKLLSKKLFGELTKGQDSHD